MHRCFLQFNKIMATLLNAILIFVVLALVCSVTWGVITRSVANLCVRVNQWTGWQPWTWLPTGQATWTQELACFMLIWITLLGGAAAFATKAHLGVDYFAERLHPHARRLVAVFSDLVVLFFALAVFIWGGWNVVSDSLCMELVTPALGWKMGHIYLALPVAGFFMVIFTIENLLESLNTSAPENDQNEFPEEAK